MLTPLIPLISKSMESDPIDFLSQTCLTDAHEEVREIAQEALERLKAAAWRNTTPANF